MQANRSKGQVKYDICSFDFDLDPMILMLKHDLDKWSRCVLCTGTEVPVRLLDCSFVSLKSYSLKRQTDSTEIIIHTHTRVVKMFATLLQVVFHHLPLLTLQKKSEKWNFTPVKHESEILL